MKAGGGAEALTYLLVVNIGQHASNQLNQEDQQEAEEILWTTKAAVKHLTCCGTPAAGRIVS